MESTGSISQLNSLIAPEILHRDVDQLIALVVEIHPEPFEVMSSRQFHQKAETIKQSIIYPISRREFFLRIAPLIVDLGDIHSHIVLPQYLQKTVSESKQTRSITMIQKPSAKLFPLAVLYEEQALYVAADLSLNPIIPVGSVITAINDVPVDFLLQVMKRLTVKETNAGQRRKIQINFPWLLAAMGYAKARYQISYRWGKQVITTEIEGLDPPDKTISETNIEENQNISKSEEPHSFYGFSRLTPKTALLWFNDFNEDPQVFHSFIDRQFELIAEQGIANLIIDVRYNDGGFPQNIKTLLAHLSNQSISWSQLGEINISQSLQGLHQKKTKLRRQNKYSWGLQWLPLEWTDSLQYQILWSDVGEKVLVEFEDIEAAELSPPAGVIVLTNGFCYSACSSFVAAVNHYSLAETMGEITGSFSKVQYAYPIKSKLLHSQLEVVLPTMKLMFDQNIPDRKVIMQEKQSLVRPLIPLTRTRQQIIQRQDSVLNMALQRIESVESIGQD